MAIPHHDAYHLSKPGKIRVEFDYSVEYLGYALNKQLIPGPNLTNQIVGVLIRFREEQVAFMGDIEAMFYQVWIPKCQQGLLRFSCWKGNNFNNQPIDHQMCVHVFEGRSSPTSCNYALKRTAIDNEIQFAPESAETLIRNFYVDDLLKSTPYVQFAISLIKAITNICKAGRFKLDKFICNNIMDLKSLQEDQRRKGVKDAGLSSGELPVERALGVQWNINEDTFGFKLQQRRNLLHTVGCCQL